MVFFLCVYKSDVVDQKPREGSAPDPDGKQNAESAAEK